ncbi:hypothetical protein CVT26_009454 [Gymnopilus dilepis]|uniref:Uncharacterized protein n=1 Tax=Gymnopilus dilepis TaxID=231916 RepID=A0A409YI87_9AGAR|nr:hypothetical protein CVT26_009454 [Gymnopilus dilepis]
MALENGSAAHLPRDSRPSGFVPSARGTTALSSVSSSPLQNTRRVSAGATRRKKSAAESVVSYTRDATDQENKRVTHQRTSSVETIRTRHKPKKSSEAAGHETLTSSFICAGAAKQKSDIFLPPSTFICGLEPFKPCNSNCVKKSDGAPLFASSANLDVDPFHVAEGTATYSSSSFESIDFSNDLSRWDMENIPTIPSLHSPPSSPGPSSESYVSSTSQGRQVAPFSTPIEDDEPLENEIPFPLSRHSKVVLENMGVKKSRTLTRTRTVYRQESPTSVEPSKCNASQLESDLPCPLPLRALCQNTSTQHPTRNESSRVQSEVHTGSAIPDLFAGPSTAKTDSWGCVHLGASDLELSITFPKAAHFEVWDVDDYEHVAIPAMLCLSAKDPGAYSGKPIALPDVSLIDIRCDDLPLPVLRAKHDPRDEYYTSYTGTKIGKSKEDAPRGDTPRTTGVSMDSISLEGKWIATYVKPGVDGQGRLKHGDRSKAFRGWYQKIWVPIPTRLFEKRETRIFHLHARVWMMGDEQRVLLLDENEAGDVYPLITDTEMTVSHLRKEREMEHWY